MSEKITQKGNGKGNRGRVIAERLLVLREYFYGHTNPERGATWSEIADHLDRKELSIDRKTFYKDCADLEMIFGLQLEHGFRFQDGETKYVWRLMNPIFQAYELKTIVNSIQSSKLIPQDVADNLTEKLQLLTDEHTRQSLNSHIFIHDRVRSLNDGLARNLDTITEAIATNRQIRFKYFEYSEEGELTERGKLRKEYYTLGFDTSDDTVLVGSPFDLTYHSAPYEKYSFEVLLYRRETGEFREFTADLDRVEDISLLPCERVKVVIDGQPIFDYERHGIKVSNTTQVILVFDKFFSELVAQKFGEDIEFQVHNDDFYSVRVEVADVESLIPWLLSCQGRVMIASPPEAKDILSNYADILIGAYWNVPFHETGD